MLAALAASAALLVPTAKSYPTMAQYSFADAVTAGLIDSTRLAELGCTSGTACSPPTGYSFCSTSSDDGGFDTQAAMATAMDNSSDSTDCWVDPRSTVIATGVDSLTQADIDAGGGKRFSTQDSFDDAHPSGTPESGWRFGVEVGSPSGTYTNDQIFAREHCYGLNSYARDDEVGWFWTFNDNSDHPVVFTQNNEQRAVGRITEYPQYPLESGKYYAFRCIPTGTDGGALQRMAANGTWHGLLVDAHLGCGTSSHCDSEIGTEYTCVNTGDCPSQNAPKDGTGINYHKIQYKNSGSWYGWYNPPVYFSRAAATLPLRYCNPYQGYNPQDYTAFRTPGTTC